MTGGGGEQGPASRTPESKLTDFTRNGVTTVLGLLGTDGVSRSLENLLFKCRALEDEGITTRMLSGVQDRLDALCGRIGLAGSAAAVSLAACAVFCNQTVGVMMVQQLLGPAYRARGASGGELAADLENTCIVLVGLIPWSIACAVPLEMLGVGPGALPYAFYLWLLPLCWLLTKRRFYPKAVSAAPGR